MSYFGNSVAANVRRSKEKSPERYCSDPRCLWRTEGGTKPCPKHPAKTQRTVTAECVVCFEPITTDQQSFEVPNGRCHEGGCRSEFNAMMVEQEGPDPLPEPHIAEWPADAYKPWMH